MSEVGELSRGFVCGTIAGWAQVFVMQPFEIVKVRLVNQPLLNPKYFGIADCFRRIFREEGVLAFYRGIKKTIQEPSHPSSDMDYKDPWPSDPTNSSRNSLPISTGKVNTKPTTVSCP